MLVFFGFLTLAGAIFIPVSIFYKGDTIRALGMFAVGIPPLILSLFPSSSSFRKLAKVKKVQLPRLLLLSGFIILSVFIFYLGRDSVSYPTITLMALGGLPLIFGPFYWALLWGDSLALRYYQFLLSLFLVLEFLYISVSLKHGLAWTSLISHFIGLAVCVISLALTFHSSVRTWSKQLRPVFK